MKFVVVTDASGHNVDMNGQPDFVIHYVIQCGDKLEDLLS